MLFPKFAPVMALLLWLSGMSATQAALLAYVDTTKGRITVELQYQKAPLAVANFITLAQGTRPHIDAATGALSNTPYYVGESFFRVIDTSTFRIAQTGSGTGTNSGGPGYTFRDEFDPTLRHVPYVLSMANSGPNSNGSQIFFVGNSTPSHLNDVHTVFGLIPDPASRAVIDAIHAAGNNGSSITAVSFNRTDAGALAFDELGQALPVVASAAGQLSATAAGPVTLTPDLPFAAGTKLSVFRSPDLGSWTSKPSLFFGYDITPAASGQIDTATTAKAFYRLVVASHPDAMGPSSLANRTLEDSWVINGITEGFTYVFDETGQNGTSVYRYNGLEYPGTITDVTFTPDAYGFSLLIKSSNLPYFLHKMGLDAHNQTHLSGRVSSSYYDGGWVSRGSGTFTLTK